MDAELVRLLGVPAARRPRSRRKSRREPHAFSASSRTLNSSFHRCLPSRLMHHNSSVPTSVTLLCRCTGTIRPAVALRLQRRRQRGQLLDLRLPSPRPACRPRRSRRDRRAEEAELRRLADHQAELLARHVGLGALLHAERHDAQRLDRRRHRPAPPAATSRRRRSTPGPCRRGCARPCRAAPARSTPPRAPPPDRGRRRPAPCSRAAFAALAPSWLSTVQQPRRRSGVRLEDAAVEQHRRRPRPALLLAARRGAVASARPAGCRKSARCFVTAGSAA